jgi:hypothetical protein
MGVGWLAVRTVEMLPPGRCTDGRRSMLVDKISSCFGDFDGGREAVKL